ncbi:class I SAM-dependent methyltransferase [Lysobacter sp. CAU 1642]|uniref:Class I SAM-dependent methyltransferase n=1 Tax=Pseudomarimonas salicorniae TaxID=2933270 RepID=A0ABT0GLP2_9GAMM|nr:class I SAM-dependent methyltransferase [Lysobacter sp. CAU 1642]MCK7595460.1 class I SAM-dependent methyltransferase [Lysobacter sp. CAU 1642]
MEAEANDPLGIDYRVASAVELPFAENTFDFATGMMSLMDIPETARVLGEVRRVLKPGAFLQFSIAHPCFDTAHRRNLRGADGQTYAIEVGGYFENSDGEVDEWIFKAAPASLKAALPKFRIPRFRRTLSQWVNLLIASGFSIEEVAEPRPTDEAVRECPKIQDAQVVAYFLHIRARTGPDHARCGEQVVPYDRHSRGG